MQRLCFCQCSVVIGPLYIEFDDLAESREIAAKIPTGEIELADQGVDLRILEVGASTPPLVRVELTSSEPPHGNHVDALKEMISGLVGYEVLVDAQLNLRR